MKELKLNRIAAAAAIGGALTLSSPAETGDAPGPEATEPIPGIVCEVTIEKPLDGEPTEIELNEIFREAMDELLSGECLPMAPESVPEPTPQIPRLVAVLPAKQDLFIR